MTLYRIISTVFRVYYILIVARVILSWIAPQGGSYGRGAGLIRFVYDITEPLLGLCRRIFPFGRGIGIDFSPIIAILFLEIIERLIFFLIQLI